MLWARAHGIMAPTGGLRDKATYKNANVCSSFVNQPWLPSKPFMPNTDKNIALILPFHNIMDPVSRCAMTVSFRKMDTRAPHADTSGESNSSSICSLLELQPLPIAHLQSQAINDVEQGLCVGQQSQTDVSALQHKSNASLCNMSTE